MENMILRKAYPGTNRTNGQKKFSDGRLNLARTRIDKRFDGDNSGPYMEPEVRRTLRETLNGARDGQFR